jgi:hypothetical protein
MAVSAFVESIGVSNRLEVKLTAANDKVEIGNSGNDVTVKGTSFSSTSFSSVSRIDIRGSKAPSQVVQLGGTVTIGSTLTIDAVSSVQFDGSWTVGALTITLSEHPGGIRGGGTVHAVGDTQLSATHGDIILDRANTFDARVSIAAAQNVSLTTTGRLFLTRLLALHDATLTSRTLQLEAHRIDSLHHGSLTLQPFDAKASISIGGYTGDYALPESDTLNHLNGFGRLTIGRADGQHNITIARPDIHTTFHRDTTVRSPLGGSITVAKHGLTSNGANLTLSAPKGTITLNGNVGLEGAGTLRFDGPVVIGTPKNVEVATPKGNIIFTGPTNDDATPSTLDLRAKETITLGAVGGPSPTTGLGGLHIIEARDVNFNGQVRAGFVKQDIGLGLGTTTVAVGLDVQGTGKSVILNADGIVLNGGIRAPGQTVKLNARHNGIDAKGDIVADRLLLSGKGTFNLQGPNTAVSVLAASVNGPLGLFHNQRSLTIGSETDFHGIHTSGHPVALLAQGELTIGASIFAGNALVILVANSIQESNRSRVEAGSLAIVSAGAVQMDDQNQVGTLSAWVTSKGNFSFRDKNALTVGSLFGGLPGIKTQGGDVALYAGGVLTVPAEINTQPDFGGKLLKQGNVGRIHVNVPPVLGRGNVTLTAE